MTDDCIDNRASDSSTPGAGPTRSKNDGFTLDWASFDAVLFDLDGVITPTASVHEQAWAALFSRWDYTPDDYLQHIDGKPRYDGVRSFLASRNVELPEGRPSDPAGTESICALGNKKNEIFNSILDERGVEPYPGSVRLMDLLDELGVPQAIVSSSKNARPVLAAAGLAERFEIVVDGVVAATEELAGKPAPDMFLRGAELVGADPARVAVIEDATSGVAAGVGGGFQLVVGVDRGSNREALLAHGASMVVDDLDELVTASGGPTA